MATTGKELPDLLTPHAVDQVLPAFHRAWLHLRGCAPPRAAVELMTAQWAGECGWGKACHRNNLGNQKARAGGAHDYTFFVCGEELREAEADRMISAGGGLVQLVRRYVYNGVAMASVRILPKHPGSCFAAFDDLVAGAGAHITTLAGRFPGAFGALWDGDPAEYAAALKRGWYYTASVEAYTALLLGCMVRVRQESARVDWQGLPFLTEDEARNVTMVAAREDEEEAAMDHEAMLRERDLQVLAQDDPGTE